jgi:Zn-dependent protease with chaperone function
MASAIHGCLEAVSHGTSPRTEELAGLLGVLTVAALVVRFVVLGVLAARRRARIGREHLSTLRIAARRDEASPATWWLDHAEPLAFSLAHGAGVIVATEGLARRLPAPEVRAVLAHERAHLRRRHHLLLTWVDALAKALPFLPLFRRAPAAVRELVELDADVSAVRTCGSEVVRRALLGVTGHGTPEGTLAMARDSVDLRLARLATGRAPSGRFRRSLACGGAAAAAAALPVVTGSVLLLGTVMVSCLLSGS